MATNEAQQYTQMMTQLPQEALQVAQETMAGMLSQISALQARYIAMLQFRDQVLKEGVDYGTIEGTRDVKVLLQPGAQKLAILFDLHPRFEIERIEDFTGAQYGEPFFRYLVRCALYDSKGAFIAEGVGEANSWESRYRYRWADEIPAGVDPATVVRQVETVEEFAFAIERAETSGKYGKPAEYWAAFQAAIADGTAIPGERMTRNGQKMRTWKIQIVRYRVPNREIHSLVNTLVKMAMKRAFVAAVLIGTGASAFFSQDLEDYDRDTLEAIGLVRQPRTLVESSENNAPPPAPAPRRDERSVDKSPSGDESIWRTGAGAKLIPELRKLTKMLPKQLFEALEARPDLTPDMPVAQIAEALNRPSFDMTDDVDEQPF